MKISLIIAHAPQSYNEEWRQDVRCLGPPSYLIVTGKGGGVLSLKLSLDLIISCVCHVDFNIYKSLF